MSTGTINYLEEIRDNFKSILTDEDIEKYAISGMNFYNMMNFENMERPNDLENVKYVEKIINKTNNPPPKN